MKPLVPALALAAALAAPAVRADGRGHLQVRAEAGVQVLLDGLLVGVASDDLGGVVVPDVPAGAHVLKAARPGFRTQEKHVVVEAGRIAVVALAPFAAGGPAAPACPPCPCAEAAAPAAAPPPAPTPPEPVPHVRARATMPSRHKGGGTAPAGQLRPGTTDIDRALEQADRDLDRGQSGEALRLYERILAVEPGLAEAHLGRGAALLDLARPGDAERALRRALELNPRFADAMFPLADALREQGGNKEAADWYRRYLDARPDGEQAANARTHLRALGEAP